MKQKLLYVFLAVLIIIIIISLLISRETTKIQSVSEPKPQEMISQEENMPSEQMQQSSFANHIIRPAITIINPRPAENENPVVIPTQQPNKLQEPQAPAVSGQSPVSTEGQTQEKPAAGITKIGKYPAEQEKHEMESHGTIMF